MDGSDQKDNSKGVTETGRRPEPPLKPLERLRAFSLAAFHASLALWALTMVFAGFVFWPELDLTDLVLVTLAVVGAVTAGFNFHAARRQVQVILRRRRVTAADPVAIGFALLTLYILSRIFI